MHNMHTHTAGPVQAWFTAHPKIDPATGKLYAFGYDLQKVSQRCVCVCVCVCVRVIGRVCRCCDSEATGALMFVPVRVCQYLTRSIVFIIGPTTPRHRQAPYLTFYLLDEEGREVRSLPLAFQRPCMTHDFFITSQGHAVFLEGSLYMAPEVCVCVCLCGLLGGGVDLTDMLLAE
jgi:hypothetical protein